MIKWEKLVEDLVWQLPRLVGGRGRDLLVAGEQIASKLDKWSEHEVAKRGLGELRLQIGELLFNNAVTCVSEKKFDEARYLLKELFFPVEESKRLLGEDKRVGMLERDMQEHTTLT